MKFLTKEIIDILEKDFNDWVLVDIYIDKLGITVYMRNGKLAIKTILPHMSDQTYQLLYFKLTLIEILGRSKTNDKLH